jgi:hemoglobin
MSEAVAGAADAGGDRAQRPTLRTLRVVQERTVYEAAGGMPFFEALVDRFYEGVAADPDLLALYPEPDDLSGARHRLMLFLAQYWGGPDTYSRERGHPRLRMRHAPFAVGPEARDRWLTHMREALDALDPPAELRQRFDEYFAFAAESMRNQD